jgi:pimeloyl-ACP methyl ester carboxylesterase
MTEIELSSGTIEYTDTGGDGPVLVLLHGLMMDASLWDGVIGRLVEIEDSYTLIPLDQPARLAAIIGEFTSAR